MGMREEEMVCRGCGCTYADCQGCIERTGSPCAWVSEDLCTACVEQVQAMRVSWLVEGMTAKDGRGACVGCLAEIRRGLPADALRQRCPECGENLAGGVRAILGLYRADAGAW